MTVELTEQQQHAIDQGLESVQVVDPRTNTWYRLVPVTAARDEFVEDLVVQEVVSRIARRNAVARANGDS